MLRNEKAKLGLLAIMHDIYNESQPEIPSNQTAFINEVIKRLKDAAEIDFPEIGMDRVSIERIVKYFNDKDYDGIIIVNLLYSPGMRVVQAFKQNRLPVFLANIQPLPDVTRDWNWSLLTTNQGIHGIQDTSNMLMRLGVQRTIVTDDWKSPGFEAAVRDWAVAAYTVKRLRGVKAAVFNKLRGMGDIMGDEVAYFRKFGIEINYESIGLIVKTFAEVSDSEVDALVAEDIKIFEIDPGLPEETHRYAARLQAAFEKFLDSRGYEAFSQNISVYEDDGMRLKQLPLLGACNMLAKGYGYSAEGDVHSMALTIIGHLLAGDPHFTEMYSLDFGRDAALMSHMGEGNWKVARKDRPIRLIDRPLNIGNAENPPTPIFSVQPGEATIASLVAVSGDDYIIVVSHGEVLDTEEIPGIPMNYTFFKPDAGIKQSMDDWLKYGGTHHQVLWLGDQRRRLRYFCDITGIKYIEV